MVNLTPTIYIELIIGFLLWWFAIYLITQNPFGRIIQLIAGILTATSIYLTSDIFSYLALATHQSYYYVISWKAVMWTIYLPIAFLYHISLLLIPEKDRKAWQILFLYLSYLLSFLMIFFETWTNLTRNYPLSLALTSAGDIVEITTSKFFWILGIFLTISLVMTTLNLYKILSQQEKFSGDWYKYFIPLTSIILGIALSPFIILGYYGVIPYKTLLTDLLYGSVNLAFIYSIIRYNLFVKEAKIIFGKNFLYSSLSILLIAGLYFGLFSISTYRLINVPDLIYPYLLLYIIIASHPLYSWLNTFINDLLYNPTSGFSVVSDSEVLDALKNYHVPARLENSPLLRLKNISKDKQLAAPIDALKVILREAIEYFKPEDDVRRTKQNLKYQLLKMLAFDQAEEGQILWELGFEDYPVRIMSSESKDRPPRFRTKSPSDYSYISRNAYIALKKEAIHDITWRLSYLEKLSKRK